MKNLQKSRMAIFILGIFLAVCAFLSAFLAPQHPESLTSSHTPELPRGVHFPVNINSADAHTLCLLEGIDEVRAERIIEHRKKHGNFKTREDVIQVKGIGEKTFDKIKSYITAE